MFSLRSQVPHIALCKQLKDLGFPQEGDGFYWVVTSGAEVIIAYRWEDRKNGIVFLEDDYQYVTDNWYDCESAEVLELYKAPTAQELLWEVRNNYTLEKTKDMRKAGCLRLVDVLAEELIKELKGRHNDQRTI